MIPAELIARNNWLLAGGAASVAASLLHICCVLGGPEWYRFFGAPDGFARAAARGEWRPVIFALGIAAILAIWAAYAFAGAGVIGRLPLMRVALVGISAVYLVRGLVVVMPSLLRRPDLSAEFLLWSSAIVLAMGLMYAIGTWQAWNDL